MNAKRNLQNRIRGWLPQEPLNPNKQMQIKLEVNPLKLKQRMGKITINLAQFIGVLLAFSLILSGLYLNSISNEKTSYNLPVEWTTYNTPFQSNGTNYNCSINLFISPPLESSILGTANHIAPIYVYLNEPSNLTSGVYFARLRYAAYNATTNTYNPQETNDTGTFSPIQTNKQDLVIHAIALSPPAGIGLQSDQQPIVRDVVFTFFCNSTGKLPHPLFTITTPINLSQSNFLVTYPYRNIGTLLLALGITSLIVALVISLVNLGKKGNYLVKENVSSSEIRG